MFLTSQLFEMHTNMEAVFPILIFLLLSHLPVSRSTSTHRGNCRPIRFEPPMLDFHEQWVSLSLWSGVIYALILTLFVWSCLNLHLSEYWIRLQFALRQFLKDKTSIVPKSFLLFTTSFTKTLVPTRLWKFWLTPRLHIYWVYGVEIWS